MSAHKRLRKNEKIAHVVAVRWCDAHTDVGWRRGDKKYEPNLGGCIAVGLYVTKDKETLVLSPLYNDSGQCADPLNIPRAQILSAQYCKLIVNTKHDKRRRGKFRFTGKEKWRVMR